MRQAVPFRQKFVATFVAIAASLVLGLGASPSLLAESSRQVVQSPQVTAERRAEQAVPRNVVPFNPTSFDRYVGYYQLDPTSIFTVSRDGEHFLARLTGQVDVEWFPESATKFFATVVHAQISFNADATGRVTELVLHQNGMEQHAPRIRKAVAEGVEAEIAQRIKKNAASPGTEAAIRHQIETLEMGRSEDYKVLMPGLAAAAREQMPIMLRIITSLGAFKSMTFKSVNAQGWDTYNVSFERGDTLWQITPLTADGKIYGMGWRLVP